MECITKKLKRIFHEAFQKCVPTLNEEISVINANPRFGHYQCNNALSIFKKEGKSLGMESPQKLCEAVVEKIQDPMFEEVVAAPQGFITMKLSKAYLSEILLRMYKNDSIEIRVDLNEVKEEGEEYEKVLVDFSSPNIAKEMHVGHLRSTILGDSICRILEFLNINTMRINHLGDWGTQFGMIIYNIITKYPNFEKEMPEFDNLTKLYQEAKKNYDSDEEFKKNSKEYAIRLQNGDAICKMLWTRLCECSQKEFNKIYRILNIQITNVGESFYIPKIPSVLDELKEKGLLTNIDDAICYHSENFTVPLFLQKSNGGFGYDSTDVASIHHRIKNEKCNCIIYVTDNGQRTHFETLFELARKTGWTTEKTRLMHVGFGLVLGENNKKFKTRSGESIKLIELINEGTSRAKKDLLERINQKSEEEQKYFKEIDLDKLSEVLCVSAIKYFDIKQHRNSDYKFSYDSMLNVKGNTGIYILYAYSRVSSIFRKSNINIVDIPKEMKLENTYEINLALQILKFPDVLQYILKTMLVHKLAEFTYDLTTIFTSFYENCKVLDGENMNTRLLLCDITRSLLRLCLELMGITPVDKL